MPTIKSKLFTSPIVKKFGTKRKMRLELLRNWNNTLEISYEEYLKIWPTYDTRGIKKAKESLIRLSEIFGHTREDTIKGCNLHGN